MIQYNSMQDLDSKKHFLPGNPVYTNWDGQCICNFLPEIVKIQRLGARQVYRERQYKSRSVRLFSSFSGYVHTVLDRFLLRFKSCSGTV